MNKKIFAIAILILLAIGGSLAYLLANNSGEQNPPQQATVAEGDMAANGSEEPARQGVYVTYSEDAISTTSGTKLLFFHAPWCPQCRALEADIKAKGVPDGVTIIKVDYDTNQALRQKYGVTLQTTFVKVDDEGKLLERYVAYDSPTLDAVKDNLL